MAEYEMPERLQQFFEDMDALRWELERAYQAAGEQSDRAFSAELELKKLREKR